MIASTMRVGVTLLLLLASACGTEARPATPARSDAAADPSTTVPPPRAGGQPDRAIGDLPAIWPLPGTNVTYATAEEAAAAFWTGYLGFELADCFVPARAVAEGHAVAGICDVDEQEVLVRDDGDGGWVVVGAESGEVDMLTPVAGASYGVRTDIEVTTEPSTMARMRRLGSLEDEGGCCTPAVFRPVASDPQVIIVDNDRTATVRSIVVTP